MKNNIFPCLWFDGQGNEAAVFYTDTFKGKITVNTPSVVNFELFGQKFMILNAGPQFQINASISFTVICHTEDELQQYWERLVQNGKVLMELKSYEWSKKYGWVKDQYGVTWQLYLGESQNKQRIFPNLMFIRENNGKALEAMRFYTEIFPDSSMGRILKYGDGMGNESHEIPENVQHAHFSIDGYTLFCLDSSHPHEFNFNEAISVVVMTDDQVETDNLWNNLTSNGGRPSRCGWLKDPYGVSWQIVPKRLIELMNDPDPIRGHKVVQSMFTMEKIVISELEKAYNS